MATTKLYDIAVKTGTYTNRHGEEKNRYENIGSVMRGDNGQFLLLRKTFNLAGVPTQGDMVLASCFEPSQRTDNGNQGQQQRQQGQSSDLSDEIPF